MLAIIGDVGALAGSFDQDLPGLPRGRGSLIREDVLAAQRPRLLRAVVSAAAEHGIAATTIADIVTRARVSRQAFYKQFTDKESCLLAAVDSGIAVIMPRLEESGRAATADGLEASLRAVVRTYLRISASEPEFTRAWTLELPNAGTQGLAKRHDYFDKLAQGVRLIRYQALNGRGRELPESTYLALVGGCHELFYRYVTDHRTADLAELEEPFIEFLLASLA
ncbi:TetR/AcrR family transcriptional regulator [Nocardia asteroides]|uniref:TetR/AcrR family transcriptional regulator n=1 Tax=Nocardia asteroides TaxID=1824 RepID=UPI00378B2D88